MRKERDGEGSGGREEWGRGVEGRVEERSEGEERGGGLTGGRGARILFGEECEGVRG